MAGLARRVRGVARSAEFRCRRAPEAHTRQLLQRLMPRTPSLALLAAVTALGFATLHIVVPTVPLLTHVFGENPAAGQLVVTMYLVGIAGGQLVYGPVSDRFGRRPVL